MSDFVAVDGFNVIKSYLPDYHALFVLAIGLILMYVYIIWQTR